MGNCSFVKILLLQNTLKIEYRCNEIQRISYIASSLVCVYLDANVVVSVKKNNMRIYVVYGISNEGSSETHTWPLMTRTTPVALTFDPTSSKTNYTPNFICSV